MPYARSLLPTLIAALLVLAAPAAAQQPAPPTCAAPEHRQFDFWVGTWEVTNPAGQVVGTNRVDSILAGCAVQEHWEGAGGNVGESYNTWDRRRGVWHQTWVDNAGTLLLLEGGLEGDAMVLRGETRGQNGATTMQRITWRRVDGDPDRVRQHWESSTDGGSTWSTLFDGSYTRR
ncbi:MAG: hypothetical protein KC645_19015 [Gemmatimonadetes bacterium]|nr:hypothetical protein [Gemmatimonadota bacterium]